MSKSKEKRKKIKVETIMAILLLVVIIGILIYFIIFKIQDNKTIPEEPVIADENKIEEYNYL